MPVTGPSLSGTNNSFEGAALPSSTVHAVIPSPLLSVKYTDGYGETQVRLVVMLGGQPYLLDKNISSNAKTPQKWMSEQILAKLNKSASIPGQKKPVSATVDQVEEKEESLPKINMDTL